MTAIPPSPIGPGRPAAAPAAGGPAAKLRQASHQLEGVFLSYLFRAMRATVPADGLFAPDEGQSLMTSMLDDELAQSAAARMRGGLGDALYHQLSRALPAQGPASATAVTATRTAAAPADAAPTPEAAP